MTRKDYQLIAEVIREQGADLVYQNSEKARHDLTAHALADALALDNPRFDRARFLTACGVN
jgi:capsule polysaccharide export protein KpsE/RkpR